MILAHIKDILMVAIAKELQMNNPVIGVLGNQIDIQNNYRILPSLGASIIIFGVQEKSSSRG